MHWSSEALVHGDKVIVEYSQQLFQDAERVARRARADTVSASYVESAAVNLALRPTGSLWADIAMGAGWTFLGAWAGLYLASGGKPLPPLVWGAGLAGVALVVYGITAKALRSNF